jgi:hypothetical protein
MLMPVIVWTVLAFAIPQVYALSHKVNEKKYAVDAGTLANNEYGDSRIAFVLPEGMALEKYTEGDNVYFTISKGDEANITLYSTFDSNDNKKYFEECVVLWADAELEDFEFEVIENKNYTHRTNIIFSKSMKYLSEPTIYRSFILMFNKASGKCCVMQSYSLDARDYLKDFVESIRFM